MLKLLIALFVAFSHSEEEAVKVAKTLNPETIININVHEPSKEEKYELYELTAFSNHFKSTGKHKGDRGFGITASGAETVEGVTIASDWDVLPKGTVVWIEGVGRRVVHDTGSAIKGHKIDVYFESEQDALEFGRRKNIKVKIVDGD